jgi:hypothetical protein
MKDKKDLVEQKKQLNHIEEYYDATTGNKSSELFRINEEEEIDLKTDLEENEIKLITAMFMTDNFLSEKGVGRVFEKYYNKYLRLRVSKDRQGRTEFVNMNRTENTDDVLNRLGNATSIVNSRK